MRLTKKSGHHYYSYGIKEKENKNGLKRQYGKSITKLGQLEDIEDELGIDLIILLKALTQGIYWKEKEGKQSDIEIGDGHLKIHFNNGYMRDGWAVVYFEDYGKTWALTKEELL